MFSDFGITNDGNYHISVECFIPALFGIGQIDVSIAVDNTEVFSFTSTSGAMGNYISLNSTYVNGTDGVKLDNFIIFGGLKAFDPIETQKWIKEYVDRQETLQDRRVSYAF